MSGGEFSLIFLVAFFICLAFSIPVTFSLGACGMLILFISSAPPSILIKSMMSPFESYTLYALFLFTMMGCVFAKTGIARLLIDALKPIIRRVKGGLAVLAVLSSAGFSTLTGSANATCATISKLLGPIMMEEDYPGDFAAATIAAASPLGQLIPPSTTCIVLGASMGISVGTMFMVDLSIGLIVTVLLSLLVYIISARRHFGVNVEKSGLREILKSSLKALPLLSAPIVVLGGLYSGIFTATEAGAVGAAHSLLLAICYRRLTLKLFFEVIADTAATTAMVMMVISASYIVSATMSLTGITTAFVKFLVSMSSTSVYPGLTFLVIMLLITGMFIDLTSLCIVLAPAAALALVPLGVNVYHLASIFLVTDLIGIITPPVGIALFTASQVMGRKVLDVTREVIPYIGLYCIVTFALIFIPDMTLWVPKLLGMNLR